MFELEKQIDVAFWKTKSKKEGLKRLQSKTMQLGVVLSTLMWSFSTPGKDSNVSNV